jgi:hypothetical protein
VRYYQAIITDPNNGGKEVFLKSLGMRLSSLLPSGPQNPVTGQTNPGALTVEMDISVALQNVPITQTNLFRVWGVGLEDIGSAGNFMGMDIAIYGGMATGLPLANPQQAGLLITGRIFLSFGNWSGTNQYIDFIIVGGGTGVGSPNYPQNFPLNWQPGVPLSQALGSTLSIALPGLQQDIKISPNIVQQANGSGHYQSLWAFSQSVYNASKAIIGQSTYAGVQMAIVGNTIRVYDGTQNNGEEQKSIATTDLMGQPVWIAPNTISLTVAMRSDVQVYDIISLPATIFTTGDNYGGTLQVGQAGTRSQLTFQGTFMVRNVRHVGNYRQPPGASWSTSYQAIKYPT